MPFALVYSADAVEHLATLTKAQQILVLDQVDLHLEHDPTLPTRRRKVLRPNPIAPWKLRLGDLRVF